MGECDTPASPDLSGKYNSEYSEPDNSSGSDLFVQIGLLDSDGNEVITGTILSREGEPFDLDELLPQFESVPNDVECLQYNNEKSDLKNDCDESLP